MKKIIILSLALGWFCCSVPPLIAQDQPAQQPSAEELEKQKAEREKNAYRLLDQVIDEAQLLRLVENRVRIQISAADMLWDQNQGRARTLFATAADGVVELQRPQSTNNNRRGPGLLESNGAGVQGYTLVQGRGPVNLRTYQLRQELVLTVARHDPQLAYQLLATTQPPANTQPTADVRGPRAQVISEDNLEQQLLSRIAALDPKFAAQNAEQMLDKGQFPTSIPEVIEQLYKQDAEAAEKLADRTVRKILAVNILSKPEAANLVQVLLRTGPRPASGATASAATSRWSPVLEQAAYVDLLSSVVDAALKAPPIAQTNQRVNGASNLRRGGPGQNNTSPQPSDAQIDQNARRLLAGLQMTLPMIDQYLPSKAALVRQKMSELGMSNSSADWAQTLNSLKSNPTTDALVQAAATAPPQMQARLYQQAAYNALAEGDTERARQIANDHLQNNVRDSVMKRIDFRELAKKAEGARLDEVRQSVARLQSDNEKIDLLIQVAGDAQKDNPKLAIQLLEDARQIVNRRATSYENFEQQLKVAHAFASVDAARSFEVLDPGISQLNELLQAASILSGFEINMFRDGEMAIQNGNGLTAIVNRYGQELAVLAQTDFERSETLAGRFQYAEPRIMTRLAIVQGLLGIKPVSGGSRAMIGSFSENFVIRP